MMTPSRITKPNMTIEIFKCSEYIPNKWITFGVWIRDVNSATNIYRTAKNAINELK